MSYKLIYYGSDILRKIADDITNIDQEIIDLSDTMFNIMYKAKGVGLAGPQIDISRKIITIDTGNTKASKLTLINPRITGKSDILEPYDEGCLSFPGISAQILRPHKVSVTGISPDGKEVQIEADGILARVLQHEIDHINGIMFIDHLEDHVRKSLKLELKKIKKLNSKI